MLMLIRIRASTHNHWPISSRKPRVGQPRGTIVSSAICKAKALTRLTSGRQLSTINALMTTTSASAAVRNSTDGPQLCYFDDSSPAYSGVTNWPEAITVSVGNRTNVAVCANLSTQSTHTYDARKTPLSGSSGTCDYEENNHFRIMDPDSLRWTGVWPNNFSDRNPCKSLTNPDLYYYGHRFYSAEISRWLSRDPTEERAPDVYAFIGNAVTSQ